MKEIIDKLSSYNIFNYLFPGTIFVLLLSKLTKWNFVENDLLLAAFEYYFVGLLLSRFGSLIIEPILRKINYVKFADYKDYIKANKKDPKLETLSETNNEYRTLLSMSFSILVFKLFDNITLSNWLVYLFILGLLIVFLFSYKKQTKYIHDRTYNILSKK